MKVWNTLIGLLLAVSLVGQENAVFTVSLSSDTVNTTATFQVIFTATVSDLKNFKAPDFEDFEVIYGPNYGSEIRMVNGDVSHKVSYTYGLRALEEGTYAIPSATATIDEEMVKTDYIKVVVDADFQPKVKQQKRRDLFNPFFAPSDRDFFDKKTKPLPPKEKKQPKGKKKSKKKRKIYKI